MELLNPNSIYNNPSDAGGIRLAFPDMMRIIFNVNRVLKVKRSIIRLSIGPNECDKYNYRCYDADISVKINSTRVRIRALTSDMSTICVYDLESDEFIVRLKRNIEPYGDKASASEYDIKKRMIHSKRIKKFRRFLNENSLQNDFEVEKMLNSQDEFEKLEVVGKSTR